MESKRTCFKWSDDTRESLNQQLLDCCSEKSSLEVILILLDHGAEVNISGRFGGWPLHFAVVYGNRALANVLLCEGAYVDAQTSSGVTALHLAAKNGDLTLCRLLLGWEASLTIQGNEGATALHLAAAHGHKEVCRLLLEEKAYIEARTRRDVIVNGKSFGQFTPLHEAVFSGSLGVVELLLAYGADSNATTQDGRTVIGLAKESGNNELVVFLKNYLKKKK